jgi:hypothetical protein
METPFTGVGCTVPLQLAGMGPSARRRLPPSCRRRAVSARSHGLEEPGSPLRVPAPRLRNRRTIVTFANRAAKRGNGTPRVPFGGTLTVTRRLYIDARPAGQTGRTAIALTALSRAGSRSAEGGAPLLTRCGAHGARHRAPARPEPTSRGEGRSPSRLARRSPWSQARSSQGS